MYQQESTAERQVFRHHWKKFYKPLAGTSLLVLTGVVFVWLWPPAGLFLWGLALLLGAWIYLNWKWTTIEFTTDNRLIYRRGIQGRKPEMISLFGRLSLDQGAVVGRLLDEGSIYLGVPGRDLYIDHIANFSAFQQRLENGPQRPSPPRDVPSLPIVIVMAPMEPQQASRCDDTYAEENEPRWIEPGIRYR